jgi:hypothetical protein
MVFVAWEAAPPEPMRRTIGLLRLFQQETLSETEELLQ